MLESQLESEHSERSLLLRERHELERRLAALEETARAENHEQTQLVHRLKRLVKKNEKSYFLLTCTTEGVRKKLLANKASFDILLPLFIYISVLLFRSWVFG